MRHRQKALVAAMVLLLVILFGWRWHETHLPIPLVPSTWVNVDQNQVDEATMFRWTILGRQISGIFTDDDLENSGCLVAPFEGSINGDSVKLSVDYLDGSGSTEWTGTVTSTGLTLNDETFVPGTAASFVKALADMNYPPCGPSSN